MTTGLTPGRAPAPSPGPVIRPTRPDDAPALAAIYGHAVATGLASFEETPPDAAEMARRHAAATAAGFPHLVAEIGSESGIGSGGGGRVVGFAAAGAYRPRPAYAWSVEDSVYVDPAAQGRGVGRALLAALIERATAGGWRQMVALIGDSGNAASIGLHAALGFRAVGTLEAVGFKHGRWVDVVVMQRALGAGAGDPPTHRPGAAAAD